MQGTGAGLYSSCPLPLPHIDRVSLSSHCLLGPSLSPTPGLKVQTLDPLCTLETLPHCFYLVAPPSTFWVSSAKYAHECSLSFTSDRWISPSDSTNISQNPFVRSRYCFLAEYQVLLLLANQLVNLGHSSFLTEGAIWRSNSSHFLKKRGDPSCLL